MTPETDYEALAETLRSIGPQLFARQSGEPKHDAQRNLQGRTHYVDDDTLRWHKCRILSCGTLYDGAALYLVTSDALDPQGSKRGFRFVVFDIFGTVIERPKLEDSFSSQEKARKAFWAWNETFDVAAYYRDVLRERIAHKEREIKDMRAALKHI